MPDVKRLLQIVSALKPSFRKQSWFIVTTKNENRVKGKGLQRSIKKSEQMRGMYPNGDFHVKIFEPLSSRGAKNQSVCKNIVPDCPSFLPFHTDQWLMIHYKKPQLFLLFFNFVWYNSRRELESEQSNSPKLAREEA